MTSNIKLFTIKLSPAQFNALYRLEESAGKNKSELVRELIATECMAHGIRFPQDVAKRGEHGRTKP